MLTSDFISLASTNYRVLAVKFRANSPLNLGSYKVNPYYIVIFFFIHLDSFKVRKLEESANGMIFTSGTQFHEMRSKTFWESFEA